MPTSSKTPKTRKPAKPPETPKKAETPEAQKPGKPPATAVRKAIAGRREEVCEGRYVFYPGQKGTIIERIASLVPKGAVRLVEPFTGSAAVASALAFRFREIVCSDALPSVVAAHARAVSDPEGFSRDITARFEAAAKGDPKGEYAKAQAEYADPRTSADEKAVLLVYLNAKAANNLVRHNLSGGFNASWHPEKEDTPPPLGKIARFSRRLRGRAAFSVRDFREALEGAGAGDFVYCDPPYMPLKEAKTNFTGYSGAFSAADHKDLARLAREGADRGAKVVVSNHDSPAVRRVYGAADGMIALAVERRVGRKKGEAAKPPAEELLIVFGPPAAEGPAPSGKKRLRREASIDQWGEAAEAGWLDARAMEIAAANGWIADGAEPGKASFRSLRESGRHILTLARSGLPALRRLFLGKPGRAAIVPPSRGVAVVRAVASGDMPRPEAEKAAARIEALLDALEAGLDGVPGAEGIILRAMRTKAAVFWEGRTETATLPARYKSALLALDARGWDADSEIGSRLLLLAELCPDSDRAAFGGLCRKLSVRPGVGPAFLEAFPPVKVGGSRGVPPEDHRVLPTGAVAAVSAGLGPA